MNRHTGGFVIVLCAVGVGVAACGSGGTKTTALPTISAIASSPAAATSAAATSVPTSSPTVSPSAVHPIVVGETISPPSGSASDLAVYTNSRFGFSVGYPTSFTKSTPPVDGDGAVFTASDGTTFRVSGVNNNNNESVDQAYSEATTPPTGTTITYRNKTGNVVTVSGTKEGDVVFYVRTTVGTGSIDELEWDYPASLKATYDPLVTATVASYKPGEVNESH